MPLTNRTVSRSAAVLLSVSIGVALATAIWVFRAGPVRSVIKREVPEVTDSPPDTPAPSVLPHSASAPAPVSITTPRRGAQTAPASDPVSVAAPAVHAPSPPATSGKTDARADASVTRHEGTPLQFQTETVASARAIYSYSDSGVLPPEPIKAELGTQRLALSSNQIVEFDLVIDPNGDVESAHMVSEAPQSVGDTMLSTVALQVIRVWKFRPARKDGIPVSFRQRIAFRSDGVKTSGP